MSSPKPKRGYVLLIVLAAVAVLSVVAAFVHSARPKASWC